MVLSDPNWPVVWLKSPIDYKLKYEPFLKQALIFMCLQYKSFENTVFKGENAHKEQFLLFPTVVSTGFKKILLFSSNLKLSSANSFSLEKSKIFSTLFRKYFTFSVTFILSSANAFKLVWSKMSFGKELILYCWLVLLGFNATLTAKVISLILYR